MFGPRLGVLYNSTQITAKEPPKKKAKLYKQKYNSAWERNPQFKGWLTPVKRDSYKAYCKVCSKELVA